MISKFVKKPVVIEAVKLENTQESVLECLCFVGDQATITRQIFDQGIVIKTLEGTHLAKYGDYIIKGVAGEFYPCNPDIFERTYEALSETQSVK